MSDAAAPSTTAAARRAARSRRALLVALGVDNLGSGLVLPLVLVYTTTVVGVPLGTAGLLVTAGTVVGLLAPPLAGGLVDRVGPKVVVVASQALQAAGVLVYLLADGPGAVLLAAALVAAGTQTFYSSVFALIADVAPEGPKDRTFAGVEVVRSTAFGVGALVAAVLLSRFDGADAPVLRGALALDAASFVLCAGLLLAFVHPVRHHAAATAAATTAATTAATDDAQPGAGPETGALSDSAPVSRTPPSVLTNRPYLALIAVTALLALPSDFLLVGMAVYLRELAPGSEWAAGAGITALTATSLLTVTVVRLTGHWPRTTSMALGGSCLTAWAALSAVSIWLPASWVGPWVLASMVLLAGGSLLFGSRVNALAEAAAPQASRGRHLAAFQYAFTAAGLLAPLLVSAMAVGLWLPWLVVGAAAALGAAVIPLVGRRLPQHAVRPGGLVEAPPQE
ncbi:MFS transporter [Quadrisphaera setariae]|uniref:MFS transporter n=1 Tax=Quadrisphaera setariae TaxID=2593304 RepID=UPI00164EDB2A|nr:MFS transporter [Quadrisphaera setariae]